jgi:hypothetical protein
MPKKKAPWKKKPGRPKMFSDEDRMRTVYQLLPADGSSVQMKELYEDARKKQLGPNTLMTYLNKLIEAKQVIKTPTLSDEKRRGAPTVVYYKRVTESDFFGIKETLEWADEQMKQIWPALDKLPDTISSSLRGKLLTVWLGVLTSYLAIIGAKARQIEDQKKRSEFIDIMLRIHVYPALSRFSSLGSIELGIWKIALEPFSKVVREAQSSAAEEARQFLFPPFRWIADIKTRKDVEKAGKVMDQLKKEKDQQHRSNDLGEDKEK